jgi:hypothetical protein
MDISDNSKSFLIFVVFNKSKHPSQFSIAVRPLLSTN